MRIVKENKCRDCGNNTFIWIITDTDKERLCCDVCGAVHDFGEFTTATDVRKG